MGYSEMHPEGATMRSDGFVSESDIPAYRHDYIIQRAGVTQSLFVTHEEFLAQRPGYNSRLITEIIRPLGCWCVGTLYRYRFSGFTQCDRRVLGSVAPSEYDASHLPSICSRFSAL